MKILQMILERAKERSTWLGLVAVLTACGVAVKPELTEALASAGVALAGLIAVVTADKKAE